MFFKPIEEGFNGLTDTTSSGRGDFNEIKNNLNLLIETMNGLLHETNTLILAGQDGKLETRGNAEHFVGDWRELGPELSVFTPPEIH